MTDSEEALFLRGRSRSRSRSRSNSIDSGNGDFVKGNPIFTNPIYPDLMNTRSNSNRFVTEQKSQFCKHKLLASSEKKF